MNSPRRNRLLQLLRSVCNLPSDQLSSALRESNERRNLTRAPRLESLEGRRVLAASVTQFMPTGSGFVVEFDEAIDTSKINLYTTSGGAMGAADVTLQGASAGDVKGSAVFSGNTMTFVAAGGVLPADTYTVTLRSSNDGFTSAADGSLLDGENNGALPSGNGTAGGDFVTTFNVSAGTSLAIGFADIARGPGQSVQGPATGSGAALPEGLALTLSNASGVTSITMSFEYDATLMTIAEVQLGPDAPSGSQVVANLDTPGVVTLSFFALSPLTADQTDVIEVIGSVPESATYGKAHVLHVTALEVNAGALTAKADDAIHVVAYQGDVNGNRRYDAEDARLIARVGVGLDTGFVSATPTSATVGTPLFPLIDPVLLGDVTGADGISPLDSSDVLRQVIGLPVPNLPSLPTQAPTDVALSSTSVASGAVIGTTVGVFTSTDPDTGDTFTYSLVSGTGDTDNSSFTIAGNALRTAVAVNAAIKPTSSIRVRTTDSSGRSFEKTFTITVAATNQAPTGLSLSATSIAESQPIGSVVGTFTSLDPNSGDTFSYSLVAGEGSTDNAAFTINNNQLVLNTASDFETKSSYSIRVRTTDNSGGTFENTFTITVTNANEAPTAITASGIVVPANAPVGTTIGTLSTTDPDAGDTHNYTLVSGEGDADNAKFSIAGNQLTTAVAFTTETTYSIRVRSTDAGGLTFEQILTGTIAAGNLAPTDIVLSNSSVSENANPNSVIGTLSTNDPNAADTHTYSLVSGDGDIDNIAFTISGNQLTLTNSPNFETQSSYSVRIRSTDDSGLSFTKAFTVTVNDVNEMPTNVALSASTIQDGAVSGTVVGTFSASDPDAGDISVYSLVNGEGASDNELFTISGNELRTAFVADHSQQSSYSVRVRVEDSGGLTFERTFTINVTDTNQAPSDISLDSSSVAEDAAVGSTVGNFTSSDPDSSDSHVYMLVSGDGSDDNAAFTIDGSILKLASTLDFETKNSYAIRVRSTDNDGLSFEKSFVVSVNDVNEAPAQLQLSSLTVADGTTSGSTVATISAVDPDTGDSLTYSLVAGEGDTDNASFTINDDQLVLADNVDMAAKSSYSSRLQVADSDGLTLEQTFVISVIEIPAAPTAISLSTSSIDENAAVGSAVGQFNTTDANSSDTHSYQLVSGDGDTDNAAFEIVNNELRTVASLDFETKSSYEIRVRTTDASNLSYEQTFVVSVNNLNEAPAQLQLSSLTVVDGSTSGSTVATISAVDPDTGDSLTYSLVAGEGDTDNASFTINDDELVLADNVDMAAKSSYSIRLQVADGDGLTSEQTFVISVIEIPAAPTAIGLSADQLAENLPAGTVVGSLSSTDPNATDSHSYSLVTGDGDTDNDAFEIVGNELRVKDAFDFETKSVYSVRIRTTDSTSLSFEQTFTVTITNVNEAPTAVTITNNTIADMQTSGTIIGMLDTVDPDADDSFEYSFVAGDGDTDNDVFQIINGELVINQNVDAAIQDMYSVRIKSVDVGGLEIEQVIQILVS